MASIPYRTFATSALSLLLLVVGTAGARGEIGDPTLRTDHPQYAGEGAFQTIEDCAEFATAQFATSQFATAPKSTPQDKAIAMYLWLLSHQWHLASPQEAVPLVAPDTKRDAQQDAIVYDANRARFSYGYGLCGTVHAWNEPYWRALGFNARRRAFPGHTNSEIEYGGSWHAFDTDMAGLVLRKDGIVAGYEDIAADPAIIATARPPLPAYPFDWPGDRKTMEAGWREIAQGGNWYKMYHSGYAAHPAVVHLRSGETFTRYYNRDRYGGPTKRRFWHHQPGGPERDWTFFDQGVPRHDGPESNCRSHATYANGEFVYQPSLTTDAYLEGASPSANVAAHAEGLRSADEKWATLVFNHFSPYVICGDPADDANPMTGPATGGLVIVGKATGAIEISASRTGHFPFPVKQVTGPFELDLTDMVKGHYGWNVGFSWKGSGGLDEIRFTTVTQVCQAIYPRLKPGGTQVTWRSTSRAAIPVLPNFSAVEKGNSDWLEAGSLRTNMTYTPLTEKSRRFAFSTVGGKPGTVGFPISSQHDLTEVSAAVRFGVPVPPPEGCDFHLDVSLDEGKTWRELGRADIPADNEYSSGWMYGRLPIKEPGIKRALVRAHLYAGGRSTGIIDAKLYGLRRTTAPQPATVTYAWRENGELRQHVERIAAGKAEHTFTVPTGAAIADEWVRIE